MSSGQAIATSCEEFFKPLTEDELTVSEFYNPKSINYWDKFLKRRDLFHEGKEGKLAEEDWIHIPYIEGIDLVVFHIENHNFFSTTYEAFLTKARLSLRVFDFNKATQKEAQLIKKEHDNFNAISDYLDSHNIKVVIRHEEIQRDNKKIIIEKYVHGNTFKNLKIEMREGTITESEYREAYVKFEQLKREIKKIEDSSEKKYEDYKEYKEEHNINRPIRVDENSAVFHNGKWILTNP